MLLNWFSSIAEKGNQFRSRAGGWVGIALLQASGETTFNDNGNAILAGH